MRRGAPSSRGAARVPRSDEALRRDGEHSGLVRAPRCRRDPPPAQVRNVRQGDEAFRVQRRQCANERQHAGAHEAVSDGRRRTSNRRRCAARHANRGRPAGGGTGTPRGRRASHDSHVPAHAAARPPSPARDLPIRACCPQVVGVGSVGARAWILLLVGRDDTDPLFLQFKEAQASVLEPFLGRSQYRQHGTAHRRRAADDAGLRPTSCLVGSESARSTASRGTSIYDNSGTPRAPQRSR